MNKQQIINALITAVSQVGHYPLAGPVGGPATSPEGADTADSS